METAQHILLPKNATVKGVAELLIYKSKKSTLVEYMLKRAKDVDINLLRRKLAKIKDSMAKDIIIYRVDRT